MKNVMRWLLRYRFSYLDAVLFMIVGAYSAELGILVSILLLLIWIVIGAILETIVG
jgi:hypothetical protein